MAFVLRRPFAVTSALRSIPQAVSKQPLLARQFHQAPKQAANFTSQQRVAAPSAFQSAQNAFRFTSKRFYNNFPQPTQPAAQGGELGKRLLYGAALFGGTVVAINMVFNRETREDGGMPAFERAYLNDTFLHTGLGIGTIAVAARALHRSGWSYRLMAANPWLVFGLGLAGSVGTMFATRAIPPEK
jgi:growth hormone-inducible transmembrane protein